MSIALTENFRNMHPYVLEGYLLPKGTLVLFKPHFLVEGRHSWALFKPDAAILNGYVCYVPSNHVSQEDSSYLSNDKAGIVTGGTAYGLLSLIEQVKQTYEWVGHSSMDLVVIGA